MTIKDIQEKILAGDYRYSDHALKRMIKRSIEVTEIEEAISRGEIIEEYPDDKYSPSCLILGNTGQGRSLHLQVSFPPRVVIITVYEPDDEEWLNHRVRRRRSE